jgi:hypothetical protein
MPKDLTEKMARALVNHPEMVKVSEAKQNRVNDFPDNNATIPTLRSIRTF